MPVDRTPLPVTSAVAADAISRRAALQSLLGGAGAGFLNPSSAWAHHPMREHLENPGAIEQAEQRAAASSASPPFLDEHQTKTLDALAEAIVPGSRAAKVPAFLDQLLAVESAANQRGFLGSLGAFDMAATTAHRKSWTALTASEQDALLREASTAPDESAVRAHFENLKGWIVGAYYSSEQGMRELGWTGNMLHRELPGCTHPGGHLD